MTQVVLHKNDSCLFSFIKELIKIKIEAGKKVSKIFDKSEAGKKNIKEPKTLLKAAGATSAAGVGAAGVSLYNKKKKKD